MAKHLYIQQEMKEEISIKLKNIPSPSILYIIRADSGEEQRYWRFCAFYPV